MNLNTKQALIGSQVQLVEGAAENHECATCRLKISVVAKELMKNLSTRNISQV